MKEVLEKERELLKIMVAKPGTVVRYVRFLPWNPIIEYLQAALFIHGKWKITDGTQQMNTAKFIRMLNEEARDIKVVEFNE